MELVLFVFSDKATNAGQMVGVDVQFDNAGFYVVDKSVTETKDKATLVISADSHGMQFNRDTFAGRFNTV